jgi:hypothetical protein
MTRTGAILRFATIASLLGMTVVAATVALGR